MLVTFGLTNFTVCQGKKMEASTLQVNTLEVIKTPYDFCESNLYLYKCYVFQYVETNITRYKNRFHFSLCKMCRCIIFMGVWCCLMFELFNFINGFDAFVANMSMFKAVMATFHRIVWMLRYVFLHNVGVYLFGKYPYKIQQELDEIFKLVDEEEEIDKMVIKIKKSERRTENIMVASVICLVILPILQKIIPILIERKLNIVQSWNKTVESIEFVIIVFSRIVSMPFFFNFIFLAYLQCIRIKAFLKKADFTDNDETCHSCSYIQLHESIRKVSRELHLYVVCLITLLLLWGSLGAYSMMEILRTLPNLSDLPIYPVIISEFVGDVIIFLSETIFLYTLPLTILGKVSTAEMKVVAKVLKVSCKGDAKALLDIANRLEKLQQVEGVGYTLFGKPLTEIKTVWYTLFGPIFTILAKAVLTEHLS